MAAITNGCTHGPAIATASDSDWRLGEVKQQSRKSPKMSTKKKKNTKLFIDVYNFEINIVVHFYKWLHIIRPILLLFTFFFCRMDCVVSVCLSVFFFFLYFFSILLVAVYVHIYIYMCVSHIQ